MPQPTGSHLNLSDIAGGLNAALLPQQASQSQLECVPSSHRWMPGDKEHNVFDHEGENGVHIAVRRRLVPCCDQTANRLLIGAHANPLSNA
jgi:hypothetical protein